MAPTVREIDHVLPARAALPAARADEQRRDIVVQPVLLLAGVERDLAAHRDRTPEIDTETAEEQHRHRQPEHPECDEAALVGSHSAAPVVVDAQ